MECGENGLGAGKHLSKSNNVYKYLNIIWSRPSPSLYLDNVIVYEISNSSSCLFTWIVEAEQRSKSFRIK